MTAFSAWIIYAATTVISAGIVIVCIATLVTR